ncbi:MAG TPA: EscU/YscU/HrcU family type III secretion system export apparatus switch protein [Solirubrobacteraceae bacterium]|nr:EscU/YscU/HrcU family type III secretion system export apparatus switch protein [Solirubrobacteraceae bacterium]
MPDSDKEQPRRRATALRYEQGRRAPEVVATGAGLVADRILAAAREAGIPVRHDPALTEALAALELGAEVPEAMWTAVAETLAWAYRLDAQSARSHP